MPPKPKDYIRIAREYADGVVSGKITACHWVQRACQRQLDDLKRPVSKNWPFIFDEAKAIRVCRFLELMPHVQGEWANRGEKLRLEPWKCFIVTTVYGWIHKDTGFRRFKTVYEEEARKNGKSTSVAPLGVYATCADGEAGARVYSAATTREQAKLSWETAKQMVERESGLRKAFGVDTSAHAIHQVSSSSRFQALSADGQTLDGLNVSFAIIDELHAHSKRHVWDVIETACASRKQALRWAITTAGFDRSGICYEVRTYSTKILDGIVDDPSFFAIIYTLDDDDDWQDEKNWVKANPNLGVSVDIDELRRLALKAKKMPSALNNFLTKHMNIWVNANVALFDMIKWGQLADPKLSPEQFKEDLCWIGEDFAPIHDFSSRALLFRREQDDGTHYYVFCKHFLSEGEIEDSENDSYAGWALDGWISTNPGNQTDDRELEEDAISIIEDGYQVQEVCSDPSRMQGVENRIAEKTGVQVVEVLQNIRNLSGATELLQGLIADGKIHHNGDPVLAWMLSNVTGHYDRGGRVYPGKDKPEQKIDGATALITALSRAMIGESQDKEYQAFFV